jgi:nicotinic acid mononucleotide adenylyltransferase
MLPSVASSENAFLKRLYQLAALRAYAQQLARISAITTPGIEIITPVPGTTDTAPLLLIPGSYNPPTTAHLALAQAGLQAIPQASLYLALGTTIINKEQTERATLLDRLLLLDQIARRTGHMGVLLTNQGLYVEQAEAARAAFPGASEIVFVVGFDKIEQIFDARYYHHRDAALKELFTLARFLVAPRATHEAADVAALLRQPDNQQFQPFVRILPFPVEYREISSSQIRAVFQTHPADVAVALLAPLLPPEALAFAIETGCYSPAQPSAEGEIIDRYGMRTALIARALALPAAEQSAIDLQRLFALAISPTPEGYRLRRWLEQPAESTSPLDLLAF